MATARWQPPPSISLPAASAEERRDECPLPIGITSDQAFAIEIERFIDGVIRWLIEMLEFQLAIEDGIGIPAVGNQVRLKDRRRSVVVEGEDERLDLAEVPHLEDTHYTAPTPASSAS